jgi:hypothetical protein
VNIPTTQPTRPALPRFIKQLFQSAGLVVLSPTCLRAAARHLRLPRPLTDEEALYVQRFGVGENEDGSTKCGGSGRGSDPSAGNFDRNSQRRRSRHASLEESEASLPTVSNQSSIEDAVSIEQVLSKLTADELALAEQLYDDLPVRDIAAEQGIAKSTVQDHIARLRKKAAQSGRPIVREQPTPESPKRFARPCFSPAELAQLSKLFTARRLFPALASEYAAQTPLAARFGLSTMTVRDRRITELYLIAHRNPDEIRRELGLTRLDEVQNIIGRICSTSCPIAIPASPAVSNPRQGV